MKTFFIVLGIILLTAACDPSMVFDQYDKTDGGQWKWSDKKTFEVMMKDSLEFYDLFINIRHTTDYPKSNLFVFLTTTAPTGISRRDTIEIIIANDRGKWEGNGFGKIKLITRKYRKAARFLYPGKYSFEIEQGMRIPEIPVTDVGFRIEKFREVR
jgi:gliding motility-associated lipoprotein GldH